MDFWTIYYILVALAVASLACSVWGVGSKTTYNHLALKFATAPPPLVSEGRSIRVCLCGEVLDDSPQVPGLKPGIYKTIGPCCAAAYDVKT